MPKKTFKTRANKFFRPIAISIISLLLVAGIVKAATTVGTNISSDGTLTIAGAAIFSGNMTVGNAGSDALVLNSGVWTLGSTATTTVAMTNGINFDSNTFVIDPSSNRIGIGTANPTATFEISQNATDNIFVAKDSLINVFTIANGGKITIPGRQHNPGLISEVYDGDGEFNYLGGARGIVVRGNYAYIASWGESSVTIIDVSNPTDPKLMSEVYDSDGEFSKLNLAVSIDVKGNYAYVVSPGDHSLTIMDISDPTDPVLMSEVYDGDGEFSKLNTARWITVSGKYAYVASIVDDSLTIIDISNPTNPVLMSEIYDGDGTFTKLDGAYGVTVSGNYAYIAARLDKAITIVNISDPTNPILMSAVYDEDGEFSKLSGARQSYISGNYLYVVSDVDDSLTIIDISDPENPQLKSEIYDGDGTFTKLDGAHNVYVAGHYAYVAADEDDALTIINVSDNSSPILVKEIYDGDGTFSKLDGAHTPYVSGNYLYLTSYNDNSFTILDISALDVLNIYAGEIRAGNINIENDARIYNNLDIRGGLTATNSYLGKTGIYGSATSSILTLTQSGIGNLIDFYDGSVNIFRIEDGGKTILSSASTSLPNLSLKSNNTSAWTKIGGDGIGWADATHAQVHSMASWNGKLYAGIGSVVNECEVWEWDGITWTKIGWRDAESTTWNNYDYMWPTYMITYNGKLYVGLGAGTGATGVAELWSYDGANWKKIAGDGIGWNHHTHGNVHSMGIYKGDLYIGTYGPGEVWKYDGENVTLVAGDATLGSPNHAFVEAFAEWNGKLYVGLGSNAGQADVWEYDGNNWTQVGGNNFGWPEGNTYGRTESLTAFNGKLYAGIGGSTGDASVWEYDGSNWTKIGGDGIGWGDGLHERVKKMVIYNGELYIPLAQSPSDAEVYSYNGAEWTHIGINGATWPNHPYVRYLAVHNGKFYVGLSGAAGDAEVWEYNSYETGLTKLADGFLIGSNFKFDDMGKLGINNLTPEKELDIAGDIRIGNRTLDTFAGNVSIGDTATSTGAKLTVKQGGTGDIVNIYDGSTKVFSILDGGIASTTALKINDNAAQGSTIEHLLFGTCSNLFGGELIAGAATTTACSATGVTTAHKIFITPKNNQTAYFNISSASSTADNILSIGGYNTSTSTAITVNNNISIEWLGIK